MGNNNGIIRVPIHAAQKSRNIRNALIEYCEHEPPFSENEIKDFCQERELKIDGVKEALRITSMSRVSLDAPI